MKADPLKLENQVCFPLYACSREIIKAYRPFLRKFGLTYTQYLVMLLLWSEKQLTAKAIGQYLHLDSGTLTPLLKKMEEKNL
jgi:DNA-binding MarR family transcriptional regulator